jgi:hypothetical protein
VRALQELKLNINFMQYLKMLEMSSAQSMRALGAVDAAMTRSLAVRQQENTQTENLILKGMQLEEQRRYNDFQMQKAQQSYDLQERKFGMEERMFPLRMDTQRLQLKAAEKQFEMAEKKEQIDLFNAIAGDLNAFIASDVIDLNDPELADEALKYRSELIEGVLKGTLDPNSKEYYDNWSHKKEKILKSREEGRTVPEDYDASTHQKVFTLSQQAGIAYEKKYSPELKSNKAAAIFNYFLGEGGVQAQKDINELTGNGVISGTERAAIHQMKQLRETNNGVSKIALKEMTEIGSQISALKKEEGELTGAQEKALEALEKQFNYYKTEYDKAIEMNEKLTENISSQKYEIPDFSLTAKDSDSPPRDPREDPSMESPPPTGWVKPPANRSELAFAANVSNLTTALNINPENYANSVLGSLDLRALVERSTWNTQEELQTEIYHQVKKKIESLNNFALEEEQLNSIFSTIKRPVDVNVPQYIADAAHKVNRLKGAGRNAVDTFVELGQSFAGNRAFPILYFLIK